MFWDGGLPQKPEKPYDCASDRKKWTPIAVARVISQPPSRNNRALLPNTPDIIVFRQNKGYYIEISVCFLRRPTF
jgi:hypothetical protein